MTSLQHAILSYSYKRLFGRHEWRIFLIAYIFNVFSLQNYIIFSSDLKQILPAINVLNFVVPTRVVEYISYLWYFVDCCEMQIYVVLS